MNVNHLWNAETKPSPDDIPLASHREPLTLLAKPANVCEHGYVYSKTVYFLPRFVSLN